MRFVDDQRVVTRQPTVALDLRQQDAVGHELDVGVLADVLGETHLVADRAAQRRLQLLGHAPRDRARGDAARLRAAYQAGDAATGRQAELGQLRGLARTGFAGDDDDLVLADQLDDGFGFAADRQIVVEGGQRALRLATLALAHRARQCLHEGRPQGVVARLFAQARGHASQPALVSAQGQVEAWQVGGGGSAHAR